MSYIISEKQKFILSISFNHLHLSRAAIVVGLVFFVILVMAGFVQTQALKIIMGINGTAEDIDLKSWSIDIPFETLFKFMDEDYLYHNDYRYSRRRKKDSIEFSFLTGDRRRILICIMQDENDKSKSVLASCAYGRGYYSLYRLDSASKKRDRVVKDLQNDFRE